MIDIINKIIKAIIVYIVILVSVTIIISIFACLLLSDGRISYITDLPTIVDFILYRRAGLKINIIFITKLIFFFLVEDGLLRSPRLNPQITDLGQVRLSAKYPSKRFLVLRPRDKICFARQRAIEEPLSRNKPYHVSDTCRGMILGGLLAFMTRNITASSSKRANYDNLTLLEIKVDDSGGAGVRVNDVKNQFLEVWPRFEQKTPSILSIVAGGCLLPILIAQRGPCPICRRLL